MTRTRIYQAALAVVVAVTCSACERPAARRSELATDQRAVLERIPRAQLCASIEVKASMEAFEGVKDVGKMSTAEITRMTDAVAAAQAVDLAKELVAHQEAGPASHFRAAWTTRGAVVGRIASLDWRKERLTDDDRAALIDVVDARKDDRVDGLVTAGRSTAGGAFGQAYQKVIADARADMAHLDSVLSRSKAEIDSLPRDDATLLSRLAILDTSAVSRLVAAHAVDVAAAAKGAAGRLQDAGFRAAYQANRRTLDSVSRLDWRKDPVLRIGGAAVCEVLGAYLKTPP